MSTLIVNAGEISRRDARPLFVGIYNDSDKELPLAVSTDGSAVEAGIVPDTIEPFGIGTITLMLKGRLIPEGENEIVYKTYIQDTSTGDTIVSIPVGAIINR